MMKDRGNRKGATPPESSPIKGEEKRCPVPWDGEFHSKLS